MSLNSLRDLLRRFAEDRDWGQFHNPKNLMHALTSETGELAECFQWLTPEQASDIMTDDTAASRIREELADVFGYLIRVADVLGVDLEEALQQKVAVNERKSRGTSQGVGRNPC